MLRLISSPVLSYTEELHETRRKEKKTSAFPTLLDWTSSLSHHCSSTCTFRLALQYMLIENYKSIIGCRNSLHAAPKNTSATSLVTHPNHTRADSELTRSDQVISSRLGGSAPLHLQPFSPAPSSRVFWFSTTPPTSSSAGTEQCLS